MDLSNHASVEALRNYCRETTYLAEGVIGAALAFVAKGGSLDEATKLHLEESRLGIVQLLEESVNGFSPDFRRTSAVLHLALVGIYDSMPPEAKALVSNRTLIEAVKKHSHAYESMYLSPT